jgi:uncharacterized membrane protein YdcZ (DUF606 family)
LLAAVAVSHLGILGLPSDPINLKKIIGAGFFISGSLVSVS